MSKTIVQVPVVFSFSIVATLLISGFAQSDDNSTAPTPAPNACDEFVAGDIYFTYLQSLEPDELILFPFEDIPGDLKLYLTDNAWTGSEFETNEGTLEVRTGTA